MSKITMSNTALDVVGLPVPGTAYIIVNENQGKTYGSLINHNGNVSNFGIEQDISGMYHSNRSDLDLVRGTNTGDQDLSNYYNKQEIDSMLNLIRHDIDSIGQPMIITNNYSTKYTTVNSIHYTFVGGGAMGSWGGNANWIPSVCRKSNQPFGKPIPEDGIIEYNMKGRFYSNGRPVDPCVKVKESSEHFSQRMRKGGPVQVGPSLNSIQKCGCR